MVGLAATSDEVLARPARGDRVVTPEALADSSPAGSGSTGYWERLYNGRIEQYGRTPAISENMGPQTYSFPVPFDTACYNLQVSTFNPTGGVGDAFDTWAHVVSYTATQFTVVQQARISGSASTQLPIEWRAIGR